MAKSDELRPAEATPVPEIGSSENVDIVKARKAHQRLVDVAFKNRDKATGELIRAHFEIPAHKDDDDIIVSRALDELEVLRRESPTQVEAREPNPNLRYTVDYYKFELERIARHHECPKAIYNLAADALCWARKFEASEFEAVQLMPETAARARAYLETLPGAAPSDNRALERCGGCGHARSEHEDPDYAPECFYGGPGYTCPCTAFVRAAIDPNGPRPTDGTVPTPVSASMPHTSDYWNAFKARKVGINEPYRVCQDCGACCDCPRTDERRMGKAPHARECIDGRDGAAFACQGCFDAMRPSKAPAYLRTGKDSYAAALAQRIAALLKEST